MNEAKRKQATLEAIRQLRGTLDLIEKDVRAHGPEYVAWSELSTFVLKEAAMLWNLLRRTIRVRRR